MFRCKQCLLPNIYPNSDFDKAGVCSFCRNKEVSLLAPWTQNREKYEKLLETYLEQAAKSKSPYQALVCLSGGKDSLFLLYKLKVEYKLRVLAFTTDINIPEIAWDNIRKTIQKLEIDHLVWRPKINFYEKLFKYLLQNQEERGAVYTVSYVYAPLFEGDAIRTATEMKIPFVFAGYSPGQPEPERMIFEFAENLIQKTSWLPPHIEQSQHFSAEEKSYFWNPKLCPSGTVFPKYVAPFHAWKYDQEEIMKVVFKLGLIRKKHFASPIFSNYPINWLLMYSDIKNLGYNPYAPEFCTLIREGKANKSYWSVMAPFVDFIIKNKILLGSEVRRSMNWLQLKDEDLKIKLPKGAYDPVF